MAELAKKAGTEPRTVRDFESTNAPPRRGGLPRHRVKGSDLKFENKSGLVGMFTV